MDSDKPKDKGLFKKALEKVPGRLRSRKLWATATVVAALLMAGEYDLAVQTVWVYLGAQGAEDAAGRIASKNGAK